MTESGLWRQYARYNTLANERLYDACAGLDAATRERDIGAFFGSLHGTLNHLLLGDRIWMARFAGETAPSTNLDAILFDAFDALRAARTVMDARIEAFFATASADFWNRPVRYINNEGRVFEDQPLLLVPHFFNHQTHHRGQAHALLSQLGLGKRTPVLDLHRVIKPLPGI
ncbi:DinB family protein [Reyranella sp. CPCC 100927]|uniref:DinB family protein n=1 Tax=Reyranella sp. CPCC 100927 TaxID=2599616 RepID=UPI0011B84B34|nr:DinB family protein [Reyranella sp. CPCC 100927]TWS99639.1 damage-inducible protein DinB [Reyranella sp. CPCC 100927]